MRALVLFSGTGSVEQSLLRIFPKIQITSVDNNPKWNSTYTMDVREFYKKTCSNPIILISYGRVHRVRI